MNMEIETTYAVQYQQDHKPDWIEFTKSVFENATGRYHNETHDFDQAFSVAKRLYDGDLHTDNRPKFRAYVTATQVVQRIYAGGTVITFGSAVEKPAP